MSSDRSNRIHPRDGYDRWASFYDRYPNPTVAADEAAFPALFSHLEGRRVLEIGCGTGRHTVKLLDRDNDVVGLDASSEMLRVARARCGTKPVTWIEADWSTCEVAALGTFDAVITSLVLEHVEQLEPFVAKIASVLRDGGEWFVSEIHPSRTAAGTFAHFRDPVSGGDVHLVSYAHADGALEQIAARHALTTTVTRDVLGNEDLARLRPGWERYLGRPMVKIQVFRKSPAR